jgi:hypothetical protein
VIDDCVLSADVPTLTNSAVCAGRESRFLDSADCPRADNPAVLEMTGMFAGYSAKITGFSLTETLKELQLGLASP